ncbi:hypothetical protein M8312_01420 [Sphingomonas sp. KRR8]|uniref:hypothetical protein n=1 Tax=Sphingomonas sp. KRR8 TaxID=2942996 RepID=UPI0020208199|nr:hypothetical protein [Sphingomonas sp. KRR8]URD61203.1 hypothetical protein M8312_01420 [Sphingomonas sp. KRR8]
MAIHKRPPHPARGPVFLIVLLVVVIGAVVLIARSAHETQPKPIEVDVTRGQPA